MTELIDAFRKVRRIVEASWNNENESPENLTTAKLHALVQDAFDVSIDILHVQFESAEIRGMIERYSDNSAMIYIDNNQTDQEKRCTEVKELCHVIIDEREDFSADGLDTLRRIVIDDLTDATAAFLSEKIAWIMVHEVVYPHELRRADLAKLERKETTIDKLVVQYDIPHRLVRRILNSAYLDVCDALWKQATADAQV